MGAGAYREAASPILGPRRWSACMLIGYSLLVVSLPEMGGAITAAAVYLDATAKLKASQKSSSRFSLVAGCVWATQLGRYVPDRSYVCDAMPRKPISWLQFVTRHRLRMLLYMHVQALRLLPTPAPGTTQQCIHATAGGTFKQKPQPHDCTSRVKLVGARIGLRSAAVTLFAWTTCNGCSPALQRNISPLPHLRWHCWPTTSRSSRSKRTAQTALATEPAASAFRKCPFLSYPPSVLASRYA